MSTETEKENEAVTNVKTTRTGFFARQPLSVLGKIAFWTFLVGTLGSIGGAIAITIGSGAPSQDIVIAAVCGLAATLLMASGIRWMQAISILLAVYLLYVAFTEPYAIDSLMNPKTDPNGGFYHFVGNVIASGIVLVGFGASIGAVVQSYCGGGRKAPRWLPAGWTLIIGMVIGAIFIGAVSQPSATTGTSYTNGVPTVHMGAGNFKQSSVTIPKGSKLLLTDDVAALHILANGSWQNGTPKLTNEPGAPAVNNVQVNGGSTEVGPFTTAGTYHIYCSVHQGMNLTIIVQ